MDGQREAKRAQMEKGEKDEHLKLLTMPRTILFYKIYKIDYENIVKNNGFKYFILFFFQCEYDLVLILT